MTFAKECMIPASHPCLDGHFPGNPVVPGVLILEQVLLALQQWMPSLQVRGFSTAKFHTPLQPGHNFMVEFEPPSEGKIRFRCRMGERVFSSGVARVAAALKDAG